jgi:UDP-N-acetylmuramyl pentapeptide phosphotransferase/UDP-N-acetylglucosamine-1-phosphate transferase
VIAFVSSALVAALLCLSARWHSRWTIDAPGSGPQKIHGNETPRVGGIAIAVGFVSALLLTKVGTTGGQAISQPIALIAALLVPFCAGLYEDITKTFGATMRLIATFIAAIIAHQLCGATMVRFDMPLLDAMLAASTVAPLLLTMFCVGGIAHAFNLSDGLNGLLGGLVIVACAVLGYVARAHGDVHIYLSACALAGATAGFLIFNFPRAKLFAGDSGAYFAGTAIATQMSRRGLLSSPSCTRLLILPSQSSVARHNVAPSCSPMPSTCIRCSHVNCGRATSVQRIQSLR